MKRLITLLVSCCIFHLQYGQVIVNAIPPVSNYDFNDLWNLTISVNGAVGKDARMVVEVIVYDDNEIPLMSGSTKPISIFQKKIIQISPATLANVGPLNIKYLNAPFKTTLSASGGVFPEVEYKVEVVCYLKGRNAIEPIQHYSYYIHPASVTPLKLVSVYNNDTIQDANPVFTWIPPGPLPSGLIDYQIVISKLGDGETKYTAINASVPLVKTNSNGISMFTYDATRPFLESGSTYAWKVNAVMNGNIFATSEVWQFTYKLIEADEYHPEQYYVMSSKIPNNCVYIDSNILPITFVEDYYVLDSLLNVKLYDSLGMVIGDTTNLSVYYTPGSNYCFVSFCPDDFPLSNGRYVLEVLCKNDKSYFIRFVNKSISGVCAF